jgi:hypothetical protein
VVGTSEGVGSVVETRTLVQLVLVRLHATGQDIAVPVEELLPVEQAPATPAAPNEQRPRDRARDGKRGKGEGGDGKGSDGNGGNRSDRRGNDGNSNVREGNRPRDRR